MVNNPTKRIPNCDLATVRELASAGKVSYAGRGVQRDVANLGYDLNDVIACLQTLPAAGFIGSVDYPLGSGAKLCCDAYETQYCSSNREEADTIYVKFAVTQHSSSASCNVIVCSFHLPH